MPIHTSNPHIRNLRETAIAWFMRMHAAEPDHPDRGRFEAWLMADTSHANVYAAVADLWDDFNSTPQLQTLASAMEQKEQMARQRAGHIKKSISNVLGIALAVIAGIFGYQTWQAQPVMQLAAHTETSQIAMQELQDGSKLTINADSDVEVTYYRDKRMVKLKRGEVIFDVAKDAERPFVVDSGQARITVLGTRFAVNRLQKLVRVSVDHGRVRVESKDTEGITSAPILLRDGQVAEIASGNPKRIQRPAADAFSFLQGVITFDQAGLEEIAETLSRYRQSPVFNQASAGRDAQITAVIKLNDIEKFLGNLPNLAPVATRSTGDRTIILDQARD